jgi:protein ImuB
MDRLACVNVAALPLQILLRAHPDWGARPVAVVQDDRPQALVLWINTHARRAGVRIGQRYAAALTLARGLQAATVPAVQIDATVRTLADRLRRFSPHVEPSSDTPGVFWIDVSGLERLYPALHAWAEAVRADFLAAGMKAAVAVGFSRFGVYALATSHRNTMVCADADEERERVRRVSLLHLGLAPEVRERLVALGLNTVGDFLRLPGKGIRARFGAATDALYQLAAGVRPAPLAAVPAEEIYERSVDFDAPEINVDRLVFVVKRLLDSLMTPLTHQGRAMAGLSLRMTLDDRTTREERVRPAAPTVDVAQLLTLVRLRLDSNNALTLSSGIVTLCVAAEACRDAPGQQRLFVEHSRRDVAAANQALARLRAECGEGNVVRARIRNAHLPAARFVWEPVTHLPARSAPRALPSRPLVRRIYSQARQIRGQVSLETCPLDAIRTLGPYVISGGWWGGGIHRDYYYVETSRGELLWVYFDRRSARFFLQGRVE